MLFVIGTAEGFADGIKNPVFSNNPIAADVDGEPIYLDDLKHVRIQEVLMQLHEMQTRSLKEKILDKLAEKHPELKAEQAPKVTEAEIKKFYVFSKIIGLFFSFFEDDFSAFRKGVFTIAY